MQEEASGDTNEAVEVQQWMQRIQDPEKVLDLLFMEQLSLLVTHSQQHCQENDHLPMTRKNEIQQLIKRLENASRSLGGHQLPEPDKIVWVEKVIINLD